VQMSDIDVIMMLQERVKVKIQKHRLPPAISVIDVSCAANYYLPLSQSRRSFVL